MMTAPVPNKILSVRPGYLSKPLQIIGTHRIPEKMMLRGPIAAVAQLIGHQRNRELALHDLRIIEFIAIVLENRKKAEMHGGFPH